MKVCCKCKKEKDITEFHKNKSTKDGFAYECKECKTNWADRGKEYYKDWKSNNKNKLAEYRYKYKLEKLELLKNSRKKYREKNKEEIKEKYKIQNRMRSRIRNSLKGKNKLECTHILIGCSIEDLKVYLQQTAINNGYLDFNISNYSGYKYHIDHITPISKFKLDCTYHQKLCFHWSNLQILRAKENLYKDTK